MEIQRLTITDKIWVVEETLKSLQKNARDEMSMVADSLVDEYRTNKELTAFTDIDFEHFYEAR